MLKQFGVNSLAVYNFTLLLLLGLVGESIRSDALPEFTGELPSTYNNGSSTRNGEPKAIFYYSNEGPPGLHCHHKNLLSLLSKVMEYKKQLLLRYRMSRLFP
jgi:hypothetical protein